MNSVLVGLFETQNEAATAQSRLIASGVPASAISLTGGTPSTSSATSGDVASAEHEGPIARFFDNLFGGSDDEADSAHRSEYKENYTEAFKRGSYGVSVTSASEAELERAEQILNESGAVDIDEKAGGWRNEGWTGGTAATGAVAGGVAAAQTGGTQTLKEVEEELTVGKRSVARGGVRVFSRMTEVPVSETVRLREEHANVQRKVVDRPATEADFAAFKEGSIELRDTAEEAVVAKTARVVGEVEVGTVSTEREETVHGTVRKTSVEVEQIGAGGQTARVADTGSVGGIGDVGSAGSGAASTAHGSANLDPITGAPGAHPVGTGIGAAAGGVAAGAAVGSVAGPVGTVVGAAVGAVAGGLAGKGVAEKVDPTLDDGTRTL